MENFKKFMLGLLSALIPVFMFAHAPDQSYTFLRVYETAIEGRFEITTDDLNKALGLELAKGITLEELQYYLPRIQEYALGRTAFSSQFGSHPIQFTETTIFEEGNLGNYVQLHFTLQDLTEVPATLDLENSLLFDVAPNHRSLVVVEYNWKAGIHNNESMVSLSFSPDDTRQSLDLTNASVLKGFLAMVESGMHHIFIGIDHILFLLALLLPAVVRRKRGPSEPVPAYANRFAAVPVAMAASAFEWAPVEKFKPAFLYVLKIITFFTVAHTITLSLAALQIIVLPSRIVESIIALSIALAALHNIRPVFKYSDWIIVFGFGLFHGFGFASVLGDIGLSGEFMTLSLLGFNLGVEVGQVIIISLIFPVLYLIRRMKIYPGLLVFGSMLLILIAMYWFVERFFEIDLPLGRYLNKIHEMVFG